MDMRSEIKKLARIEDGQYPFLSLYLNTKWDDEQHIVDAFSIDFSEEKSKVILHVLERLLNKEREEVVSQIQGITEKALKVGMATFSDASMKGEGECMLR